MPIMRCPSENITMREIYDRYDENIVHILNGEYDYIEAYPDKNIVNDNGEIVGYEQIIEICWQRRHWETISTCQRNRYRFA